MMSHFSKYVKDYVRNRIPSAEEKAKEFFLAATGGVYPEHKPGEKIDWEHLAFCMALGHELASKPKREKSKGRKSDG